MKLLTKFLTSAADARQFPAPSVPEIAFLGRSNVGKSSLINSLLDEKVAKTSSTPGRTRTINFFAVRRQGQPRPDVIFADLPGYGYAKLPKDMTAKWPKFIDPYLLERPTLASCICLIDVNVPVQERDQQLIEWLRHNARPFLIVGTKSDRTSNNQLRNALHRLEHDFQTDRILAYSAKTGAGREELWKEIRVAAEKLNLEGGAEKIG